MTKGAELIARERRRQIEREGFTAQHDDNHYYGALAAAGAVYALIAVGVDTGQALNDYWPLEWRGKDKFKPKDKTRNLVRAGALIAAEIDRLKRMEERRGLEIRRMLKHRGLEITADMVAAEHKRQAGHEAMERSRIGT